MWRRAVKETTTTEEQQIIRRKSERYHELFDNGVYAFYILPLYWGSIPGTHLLKHWLLYSFPIRFVSRKPQHLEVWGAEGISAMWPAQGTNGR